MREITAETAAAYLQETKRYPADTDFQAEELSGGVSNIVIRIGATGRAPFVIKQCRERLRVAMEWHARLERIWAERAALELLGSILPEQTVPALLWEDRPNFLFAMACAPDDSSTWKSRLMEGTFDQEIAKTLGKLLGLIHGQAAEHPVLHGELADTSLFEELRVDPYYRTTARAHPDLAKYFGALIDTMERMPVEQRTLVLGDFSPKNILVHSKGVVLLDFECAHRGDAAFDLGFFLSHLLLKTIHLGGRDPGRVVPCVSLAECFLNEYQETIGLIRAPATGFIPRVLAHTAACLLARVDGKSPVEYLDPPNKLLTREFASGLLQSKPSDWRDVRSELTGILTTNPRKSR